MYGGTIGRTHGEMKLKKPPKKAIPNDIINDDPIKSKFNITTFKKNFEI